MPTGKEMMATSMIKKLMEFLPPDVFDNIKQIGVVIGNWKEQLDRIEARQITIENALFRIEAKQNAGFSEPIIERGENPGTSAAANGYARE